MVFSSCVRRGAVSSILRPGLFENKVAIVTGGGTGIGKAISHELLYLGCKVMIASRSEEKLQSASKQLQNWLCENERDPSNLEYQSCNIRRLDDVQKLVSNTLRIFGRLDCLVNNGGGQFPSPAENISIKGWNAVIETNLTGTFLMCQEAYNQWMNHNGGAIINIIAAMWEGFPFISHTGAARSAVDNLTKTLALEWVASGVRVNAVAPGVIYSSTASANYATDLLGAAAKSSPYRRLGTVEEVSSAVCFLLSPGARFVTGASLQVDGGQPLYSTALFRVPEHSNIPSYTWDQETEKGTSSDTS